MNATAEQLDRFLHEADPATAKAVEQIVQGLLSLRQKTETPISHENGSRKHYQLPARSLGARQGLDLTKLAHADEDL